jgi:hypothetical protein
VPRRSRYHTGNVFPRPAQASRQPNRGRISCSSASAGALITGLALPTRSASSGSSIVSRSSSLSSSSKELVCFSAAQLGLDAGLIELYRRRQPTISEARPPVPSQQKGPLLAYKITPICLVSLLEDDVNPVIGRVVGIRWKDSRACVSISAVAASRGRQRPVSHRVGKIATIGRIIAVRVIRGDVKAVASSAPVALHRLATCVPVFCGPL